MILGTSTGVYKFLFEDEFRILGRMMNRQGKTSGAVEERMQFANKAFGRASTCTGVRMFRGEQNVNDWWIMCAPFFPLEAELGRGHSRHWNCF